MVGRDPVRRYCPWHQGMGPSGHWSINWRHSPRLRRFQGTEREEVINNLVRNGGEPTDWVKAGKVLRRDWPDVASFYDQDRYSEFIGPGYLELQGITADQFLGRTK